MAIILLTSPTYSSGKPVFSVMFHLYSKILMLTAARSSFQTA